MDYVAQPFQVSLVAARSRITFPDSQRFCLCCGSECANTSTSSERGGREGGGEGGGGGGGGGRVDEGVLCADKQRFARWDLWFNVAAQASGLFSRV